MTSTILLIPASIDAKLPSAFRSIRSGLRRAVSVKHRNRGHIRLEFDHFSRSFEVFQAAEARPLQANCLSRLSIVGLERRRRAARPDAILRHRRGNLSASFENSGSVIRATTESHAAIN